MPRIKKQLIVIIGFITLSLFSFLLGNNTKTFGCKVSEEGETCLVTKVIDGDTIEIGDGRTIRYIGVDTPETVKPNSPVECFGKEASNRNKELVKDKEVLLVKDKEDEDRYGRSLRYVYVEGKMINKILVSEGYALEKAYPPNTAHQKEFRTLEEVAKANKLGLWGKCENPSEL